MFFIHKYTTSTTAFFFQEISHFLRGHRFGVLLGSNSPRQIERDHKQGLEAPRNLTHKQICARKRLSKTHHDKQPKLQNSTARM